MSPARWRTVALICGCLLLSISAARAQTAPVFSLEESDITFDSNTGDGVGSLRLKADGLDAPSLELPLERVEDLQTPQPPAPSVQITSHNLSQSGSSRRWVLTVNVKGLPRNSTQKRYLTVSFAGQNVALPYTITNKSTATFGLSVKGPPAELSVVAGDSIGIGIAVLALPATHLRVMQNNLVEQSRKTLMKAGLVLCRDRVGDCDKDGLSLDANSANQLWLRVGDAPALIGKFVGTVTIGSDQKPEGDTINLTIYGTTLCRQLLGALVILIGVIFAWVTTTGMQSRQNRAQTLLPARVMAERVETLQSRIKSAPPGTEPNDYEATQNALRELQDHLSATWLDEQGYLPRSPPLPFKEGVKIDEYKQFLSNTGTKIALLSLIIDDGFVAVWRKIPAAPNPQAVKAIRDASSALDRKGAEDPVPSNKDAIAFIQNTLTTFEAALANAAGAAVPPGLPTTTVAAPTTEQLLVEIRNLSFVTWLVFGILATTVGVYILIISNLGFGVPADFFLCLFWGFGLPISGQQLVQSSVGSVANAIGISVPKIG